MTEPAVTDHPLRRKRLILALRWLLTLGMLVLLSAFVDTGRLITELSRFSLAGVGLALLVSVLQVVVSAWRWRFTAGRLGLALPLGAAVREYYLALFLNQCLPGGVMGDVNRAWRHGQGLGDRRSALHAVMIERLSGQVVMVLVALAAGLWLALHYPGFRIVTGGLIGELPGGWWLAIAMLAVVIVLAARTLGALRQYFVILGRDIYRGLLQSRTLPIQLLSSFLVVASYLGIFLLLALHVNTGTVAFLTLAALGSLLLLAMLIPLTVAGWGVREGAAAMLWPLAGLPAEQGVALSVGYGLTVLLASLPGAFYIFTRPAVR